MEVTYRQIIEGIPSKWDEFTEWQRAEISELINNLNSRKNIAVTLEVVKLKHNNAEVISHTFSVDFLREEDLIRAALLYIYMQGDNPDGAYEINVYVDEAIDDQYLVVIDDRKVILCSELTEIDLKLCGGAIE